LRDEEFPEKKSGTEKRILFLGDSFIEGMGVAFEDTMVKQSQELLKKVFTDSDIRTINAGVSAYSPLLENLYLQHRGINLDPDLVVVNVFMNDFNDDRSYLQKAHVGPDGQVESVYVELKQHLPAWLVRYLDGRSFSYHVFKQQERKLWKLKGKFVAWIRREPPPEYAKSGVEFSPGNPDRDPFAITRDISQETFEELFRPTATILLQMKQYLDQRGIPLIIVVIPAGHQVGSNQWAAGRLAMHLTELSFPDRVVEEFEEFSQ
jgi:lysophospholipase L1-like esterase